MNGTPASAAPCGFTVAIAAFAGINPFHLSVPALVFGEDRRDDGIPLNRVIVCSEERGPLASTAGFTVTTEAGLEAFADADIVIIPTSPEPLAPASPALLDALRRGHAEGKTVVGLCLGAFVLAQAGLLDGRRATTHWMWAERFQTAFPRVELTPDALYVEDEGLLTSAGTAAALDCCLHLLRTRIGAELANRVARRIVVAPHRQGGQAQYVEQPLPARARDHVLQDLLDWLRANLKSDVALDTLAERTLMSRRTLTRRFREHTGMSIAEWTRVQRVEAARRLLETSPMPIEAIADAVGFGSGLALRQQFQSVLGTTPSAYRKAFGSTAP